MKRRNIMFFSVLCLSVLAGCQQKNTGVVEPETWKKDHPAQVEMFQANSEMSSTTYGGSEPIDYLAKYPYLKTFYEGYGFAIQYDRARGHVYALEDVLSTQRPKKGASCLACKTSEFNEALMKDKGVSAANFEEFAEEHVKVGFTCYDCHGETPGELDIQRVHIVEAVQQEAVADKIPEKGMACAQCHTEYYMTTDENAVVLPWESGLGCDEAFAYYESIGFSDWEHPRTGAKLLKAQHPELETFDGSLHASMGLTCTDCHMPEVEVNGEKVSSHHWTSPLKNNIEPACFQCHKDQGEEGLKKAVESLQKKVTEKTEDVSLLLEDFINRLAEKKEAGELDEELLASLQAVHREAQFYWDYVFVENGEGFHNTDKQMGYLDHAEKLLTEAMKDL